MQAVLEKRAILRQPVVVAVSGGADSVALLRILCELKQPLLLEVSGAHFDHGLRPDSSADAAWVQELCAKLGIRCRIGSPESPGPAKHIEAWARRQRYAFLKNAALEAGARWVAVGHTADDQAETVLHHVIRGTGLAGLAGMPQVRSLAGDVRLIRPCLDVSRAQLRESLREREQPFRDDPSNQDGRFTRSAIRNELLPFIHQRFGRDPVRGLLKLAEQAQLATAVVRRQAHKVLRSAVLETTASRVRLSGRAFEGLADIVLQESAVVLWRRLGWSRGDMTQQSWKCVARLLRGDLKAGQWPGGVRGIRRGELVVLERTQSAMLQSGD